MGSIARSRRVRQTRPWVDGDGYVDVDWVSRAVARWLGEGGGDEGGLHAP